MIKADAYKNNQPKLSFFEYFTGHVTGYGMVENRSGEIKRRFKVEMMGESKGDKFYLDEHFVFDDGEKQFRQWQFQMLNENEFIGTAADVTGAAKGEQYGNAIHIRYVLQVPVGKKIYNVNMDDWLYAIDSKVLLNRANMKKFGFHVGAVTTSFVKNAHI